MTELDRAMKRLSASPPEASFDDVRRVPEAFGWRQKGSHVSFVKADAPTIIVPLKDGSKVKRHYIAEICRLLGLDDER